MKKILLAAMCGLMLIGCCRKVIPISSTKSDSVRIEKVVEYRETIRLDTVFIPVPAQSAERTTSQDSSRLETDFAASIALINPDGTLYHNLWNKSQKVPITVPVVEKEIKEQSTSDRVVEEIKEVPVKMPLSTWEKIWITLGKVAGGVFLATLIFLAVLILCKLKNPFR